MTDARSTLRRTAIVGARIVDAATGTDEVGTCLLEDGQISDVGADVAIPSGFRVIDGAGLALLPGLIDSHAHVAARGSDRSPAHDRLLRAGVTTAVDFSDFRSVVAQWHASTAGLSVLGLQALPAFPGRVTAAQVTAEVESAVRDGAFGIKIFGGHYPSSPETTAAYIWVAHEMGVYIGFHAGTTAHGSTLEGMEDAIALAEGRPFHLAHTNSYLRGAVDDPIRENLRALTLLREHPEVRSEAYLGEMNSCTGTVEGGELTDHVTRTCLSLRGYPASPQGLRDAFREGYAHLLQASADGVAHVTGPDAVAAWERSENGGGVSFPVNPRITAFLQTCARVDASGRMVFQGPGEFLVDAISSDGGRWRNVILEQGLGLVHIGGLSLQQFVHKASWRPAQMFGLSDRGAVRQGYRADLVLVDVERRRVRCTFVAGRMVFDGSVVIPTSGEILTTERGAATMSANNIPYRIIDPRRSALASSSA